MTERPLYIGIMSGTSIDAVDACVIDFSNNTVHLVASHNHPFSQTLKNDVIALTTPQPNEIDRLGKVDRELGELYALTVNELLVKNNLKAADIVAIGCHGQTIRHRPYAEPPFTLQIGDANTVAFNTGITTVADFRRRDIAAGGQGAPLVPAFHKAIFHSAQHDRLIINIGGMANITALPTTGAVLGFDTGPGNVLLDAWIQKNKNVSYDNNGEWASQGKIHASLLSTLMAEPYFNEPPPKSTGRELFNLSWLEQKITSLTDTITTCDVQTTLVEFTAQTISNAIRQYFSHFQHIYICGGGAYNVFLMARLENLLRPRLVASTAALGLSPQWVESAAFAWLAKQTMDKKSGNLCEVTGATRQTILGAVYYA